ncbi:MAG: zinc ribbon domain-containing protein [Chloroflexaceae bacterium]|nr:zinc ribbon domain-containing protein [Chloroflexaceae bacterium]
MVERICRQCHYGNPLEHRFCGRCGASLDRHQLTSEETSLVPSGSAFPIPLRRVGRTIMVSLLTLAAEAGMVWLRRKIDHMRVAPANPRHHGQHITTMPATAPTVLLGPSESADVTITKHRVIQVWDHGQLTRELIEQTTWRKESF